MNPLTLPPAWDTTLDLCVLVGNGAEDLAKSLVDKGQKRLFVVAPVESASLPEGVIQVTSPGELLYPIVSAPGAAPKQVVVHPTGDAWATEQMRNAVVKAARDAVKSRQAQHLTLERNGATWLDQGIKNIASLAQFPPVTDLYGEFADRTAFVCAPGPSLSLAMEPLKQNRENCLVIAVSHATQPLIDAGICPDIVIAADPGNLDRHFRGVDTSSVGALVIAATCRASLFRLPARTHFHFAGNGRIDDWAYTPLNIDARLASGGSVTCSAASLALNLGCKRVVFSGLDLSFPSGRYYATESMDGDAHVVEEGGKFFLRKEAGAEGSSYSLPDGGLRFSADQSVASIPAVGGGQVSTSPAMRVYLTWFEALAQATKGDVELVQTSPDGAFIAGFQHNSIEEEAARANHCGTSFHAIAEQISQRHARHDAGQRLREHFQGVSDALPVIIQLARQLSGLSARAAQDPSLLEQLHSGEQELRAALHPLALLTVAAHGDLQRAEAEARAGTTIEENMRATRRIFIAVERAARLVQPALSQALLDLEALDENFPIGIAA